MAEQEQVAAVVPAAAKPKDPLVGIHEYLHAVFLQHFTGKELRELSEVSPSWFGAIAQSKSCMEKIRLVIGARSEVPQTNRKYQAVLIKLDPSATPKDANRIVAALPHVVHLELEDKSISLCDMMMNLRTLGQTTNVFIARLCERIPANQLETLALRIVCAIAPHILTSFLRRQTRLKDLTITYNLIFRLQYNDTPIVSGLEKLTIAGLQLPSAGECNSFGVFVALQAETLKEIKVTMCNPIIIAKILEHSRVESLCLGKIPNTHLRLGIEYPSNPHITTLKYDSSPEHFAPLLKALPNLTTIYSRNICAIDDVVKHCMNVRNWHHSHDGCVNAIYNSIKRDNPTFNQNIQLFYTPHE